jgi:poly(3-hydroxybutyrate) depolymerase
VAHFVTVKIKIMTPGITNHQMTVLGAVRNYTIEIPKGFDPATGSLFFFFKGGGTTTRAVKAFSKALVENNMIGMYPEAIDRGPGKANWALDGYYQAEDILFFTSIRNHYPKMKVFLSGVSNGGCFALLLTVRGFAKATTTFAASAWATLDVSMPANVFAVHGMTDQSVPYFGGFRHGYTWLPAPASIKLFAEDVNGHSGHYPGATMLTFPGQTTAQLLSVEGIGHSVFTKYKGIDLIKAMFQFFKNTL